MKKIIALSFTTVLIISSFVSCKKGENDPFLSLRSRKARLEGIWEIGSQKTSITSINGGTTEVIESVYDGTNEITTTTTTTGTNVTTTVDTVQYSYSIDIKKDGKYTELRKTPDGNSLIETEGNWIFIGKSKVNDLKNKEAILLTTTKTIVLNNGFTNVIAYEDLNGKTLVIDQLKNKEMITISEINSNNEDGLSSDKSLVKTTYIQK